MSEHKVIDDVQMVNLFVREGRAGVAFYHDGGSTTFMLPFAQLARLLEMMAPCFRWLAAQVSA